METKRRIVFKRAVIDKLMNLVLLVICMRTV
jgi:hypothetical protein